MTDKIALEVAESEFARLCATRRIDTDESEMDADDLEKFSMLKAKILRGIRAGRFSVVGDDGTAAYTDATGKTFTFLPATGAMLMAADDHPDGKNIARTAAVFTAMTKSHKGDFARLDIADANFCQALVALFLGAG